MGEDHLVILGPPGSGKTTLIKHMTLLLADPKSRPKGMIIPDHTPIFIYLRDHFHNIANYHKTENHYTLINAVIQDFKTHDFYLPENWLKERLASGKCFVFLDGLDEIANAEDRLILEQWVQNQMFGHNANKFIITSRPHGYENLQGVTTLEIQPFTFEQIKTFINNWYLADETMYQHEESQKVQEDAKGSSANLLKSLQANPELMDLAVNPLFLTIITTIHRYRGSLPISRAKLYEEICDVFLGKRVQSKGLELTISSDKQQILLQPLAHHMMINQVQEISAVDAEKIIKEPLERIDDSYSSESFLKFIVENSGLLVERDVGSFSFTHKTFQEYLTAVYLIENGSEDQLLSHISEPWWHETIRFFAAVGDTDIVINTCLKISPATSSVLLLAIVCADENPDIDIELKEEVENLVEHDDVSVRKAAASAYLENRLNHFFNLAENIQVDPEFVSNAEYQLFIDEMGAQYKPDHWEKDVFVPGSAKKPVVGMRPSAAQGFCGWMNGFTTSGLTKEKWNYRLPEPKDIILNSIGEFPSSSDSSLGWWMLSDENQVICKYNSPSETPRSSIEAAVFIPFLSNINSKAAILSESFTESLALFSAVGSALNHSISLLQLIIPPLPDSKYVKEIGGDFSLGDDSTGRLSLVHTIELDITKPLNLDHAYTLIKSLEFDPISASKLAEELTRELTLAAGLARELNEELEITHQLEEARSSALDLVKNLGFNTSSTYAWLAANLFWFLNQTEKTHLQKGMNAVNFQNWRKSLAEKAEQYQTLAAMFTILEKRRNGSLFGFEGIRLVRELV